MKRHGSPAGGAAIPRPAGRARPRGAVIGAYAILLAAALLAAACSSSAAGPQVASLGGHHGGAAGPAGLTTAQSDQDMLNFTRCMRAHGVNMPDPVHIPGHTGLSLEFPGATPSPNTRAATTACTHFIQPIIQAKNAGAAAAMSPARLAALTRYARCMRAHDIPMLDPTSFGALNLGRVPGISSDFGRYSPQFRAADSACRPRLPAGVADNGTGP
jgi:hypothetical protein